MIIEDEDSGTINVAIRIRPLSSSEKERGDIAAWNVSENRDKIIASDALKEYIQTEQKNVKKRILDEGRPISANHQHPRHGEP